MRKLGQWPKTFITNTCPCECNCSRIPIRRILWGGTCGRTGTQWADHHLWSLKETKMNIGRSTLWGVHSVAKFCFLLEVAVTNRAAHYLQYQPNRRWNVSKILYRISRLRGCPTVYVTRLIRARTRCSWSSSWCRWSRHCGYRRWSEEAIYGCTRVFRTRHCNFCFCNVQIMIMSNQVTSHECTWMIISCDIFTWFGEFFSEIL